MLALRDNARIFDMVDRMFGSENGRWIDTKIDRPAPHMPMDVMESDNNYMVSIEMPGVNEDDISITIDDMVLTIEAERTFEDGDSGRMLVSERKHNVKYTRKLRLTKDIDTEANIEAEYDAGVLHITLPKSAEMQPRQIPVRAANKMLSS